MRLLTSTLAAAALTLLMGLPALAGGWATVTLDQLPTEFQAGQTYRMGFTILQHGITPFDGGGAGIRARSATGQTATFAAKAEGPAGHYVAEVKFPSAGMWTWEIAPGPFAPQPLAPIEVVIAGGTKTTTQPAVSPAPLSGQIVRGALAVGTVLAGVSFALQLMAFRRRAPVAARVA